MSSWKLYVLNFELESEAEHKESEGSRILGNSSPESEFQDIC